eukprot:m.23888 g.23888  ORF g.23888 m.23888 type:complete len:171 (-) comp9042_c0_seq1:193-705(-)
MLSLEESALMLRWRLAVVVFVLHYLLKTILLRVAEMKRQTFVPKKMSSEAAHVLDVSLFSLVGDSTGQDEMYSRIGSAYHLTKRDMVEYLQKAKALVDREEAETTRTARLIALMAFVIILIYTYINEDLFAALYTALSFQIGLGFSSIMPYLAIGGRLVLYKQNSKKAST